MGEEDESYAVENSQFLISRMAFRDDRSLFQINNINVTTTEVADFLRNQGIDQDHNMLLIMQVKLTFRISSYIAVIENLDLFTKI